MENINLNNNQKDLNILIATPCYNGQVYASYTEALINTIELFKSLGIQYSVRFIKNQIVTRARNMLSYLFLEESNNFSHMMFIDADIVWDPRHIILLLQHQKECVIGIYPNKGYDDHYNLNPSSKIKQMNVQNNLVEIEYASTGFMLLNKGAFERIKKDVDTFYLPDGRGSKQLKLYNFFDCNVVNESYLTEDYYFSHLYNKNGGVIYADARIQLKHLGTHEYFQKKHLF